MPKWDSDLVTSYILRSGVVVSIFFIIAGLALVVIRNGAAGYDLQQIASLNSTTVTSSMINLSDLFSGVAGFDGLYFIAFGLWVLIFTPVSVVAVSLVEFANQKNLKYVVMSLYVLSILLISIFVL
ncbi:MAG: DUF1634 domain-containing protein [Candidatus Thermoplasmatota archaeon]|nr:DUF1634 domain-containing protein [Candidatus Thermoplasmatota archaeon]